MIMDSRRYSSTEAFVSDFLSTLTPGIIPNQSFIKWDLIDRKITNLKPHLDLYYRLKCIGNEKQMIHELSDSYLSSDDPLVLISCGFELLGHTSDEIATKQDYFIFKEAAERIRKGDEATSTRISAMMFDLGLGNVISRNDLDDLLLGIQIGLETHRRKNVCGDCFRNEVGSLLKNAAPIISKAIGKNVTIKDEYKIDFSHNGVKMSKKVDFGIAIEEKIRFGIEVNFYSSSGSKPTEIKRSYGNILDALGTVGVDLIWITDGKGYLQMRRSLGEAYAIVPNIYNYNQANKRLPDDIINLIKYGK